MQAVKIVRETLRKQIDDIVRDAVGSLFPRPPRERVHNEMVGTMSTVVRQDIVDHTRSHNFVPGSPGDVVVVAGYLAPPSSSGYSGESGYPPPSSLRDHRRGHHDDPRRDRSRSKSSDRVKTPPPHVLKVENLQQSGRNHVPTIDNGRYDDNRRPDDYRGLGDDGHMEWSRCDEDYHRHDDKSRYEYSLRNPDNIHRDDDRHRDDGCGRGDNRLHGDDNRRDDDSRRDDHRRHDDVGRRLSNFPEGGDDGRRVRQNPATAFSSRQLPTSIPGTPCPDPNLLEPGLVPQRPENPLFTVSVENLNLPSTRQHGNCHRDERFVGLTIAWENSKDSVRTERVF